MVFCGKDSGSFAGESLELFDEEGEDSFKVLPDDPNKTSQTIGTLWVSSLVPRPVKKFGSLGTRLVGFYVPKCMCGSMWICKES